MLPEALMMMIWFIDNCLFILVWNLKCFIVGIAISSAFIMVLKLVLSFQLLFLPQVILFFFIHCLFSYIYYFSGSNYSRFIFICLKWVSWQAEAFQVYLAAVDMID